jgi:NADPH2:quinone reductase
VLFHAAAGGVGLIACQWAKALGLQLDRHRGLDEKCRLALEHGAATRSTTEEDFAERVADHRRQGREGGLRLGGQGHLRGSLDCLRPSA